MSTGDLQVFTSGAYIKSYMFEDGHWGWVIDKFEEGAYDTDGNHINVYDYADTEGGLIQADEED